MKERYADIPSMRFEFMDCTKMTYPDESFEVAIDKSTLDTILCGKNSHCNAVLMLKEAQRVLTVGGYYIAISYGLPDNRLLHFQRQCFDWSITSLVIDTPGVKVLKSLGKPFPEDESVHYVYIC